MAILGPQQNDTPQDRFLRCEEDLEAAFQALIWKAMQAGWDEGEACAAIASLADHHILAMRENDKTETSIRKIKP